MPNIITLAPREFGIDQIRENAHRDPLTSRGFDGCFQILANIG